jgi:hypothetical protein
MPLYLITETTIVEYNEENTVHKEGLMCNS